MKNWLKPIPTELPGTDLASNQHGQHQAMEVLKEIKVEIVHAAVVKASLDDVTT